MKHTPNTIHQSSEADLKQTVLHSINDKRITPKPWWYFFCGECLMSTLWASSVVVGALAVAVILHVGTHSAFALVEATHRTVFAFVLDVLPYVWLFTFILMAGAAVYYYRHTKLGYRRSIVVLLGSSIFLSVTGGVVLHAFGAGAAMDRTIAYYMPMYLSMEQKERAMWQQPAQGRLLGVPGEVKTYEYAIPFTDVSGVTWELNIQELHARDIELLQTGDILRVLGFASSTASSSTFIGCGVFSWLYDTPAHIARLQAEREAFVQRMRAHHNAGTDVASQRLAARATSSLVEDDRCAEHAAVSRLYREVRSQ